MLDRSKIYPALAQRGILSGLGTKPYEFWDLGPRVSALLWEDLGNATRAITPAEASTLAGSELEAVTIAMANLEREVQESRLLLGIAELPLGGKFAFFDRHWLAGATVLHDGLMPWIANSLGATQLMASVPAPESVAYFAADCSDEVRQAVEVFVTRAGQEARKPLGRNEYRLVDGEPVLVD